MVEKGHSLIPCLSHQQVFVAVSGGHPFLVLELKDYQFISRRARATPCLSGKEGGNCTDLSHVASSAPLVPCLGMLTQASNFRPPQGKNCIEGFLSWLNFNQVLGLSPPCGSQRLEFC